MSPDAMLAALKTALPSSYSVDGYLQKGGQGSVFSGTLNGERVALKLFDAATDRRRLDRELQVLSAIDCPYLVKVRRAEDINLAGTRLALVSYEFLPGGDLRQFLDPAQTSIAAAALAQIGTQVSIAMTTLWKERIVHRDIKPANIVKAEEGRYVLVDLGVARHIDRSALTAPGVAPGTPGYLYFSPEQAQGRRNLTIHSDVFSLGVTLYEIAARRHPFNRTQHLIGRMTPQPLAQLRTDLPEPLTRLIHQMMAFVSHQRPYNVRDRFSQLAGA